MGVGDYISIAGLVIVLAGGIAVWANRVAKGETASAKVDRLERDLSDFKERVARDYATAAMVAATEKAIGAAIDRLADRIDRILERRIEH